MSRPHSAKMILLYVLVLVSVSCVIAPMEVAGTKSIGTTTESRITLTVLGADYTDADGDLVMNDAVVWFDILLSGDTKYSLMLFLSLVQPSGNTYSYTYLIITSYSVLHCTMYFYDHVTEPGYYIFNATAVLRSWGQSVTNVQYLFDPPGGSGDTDPCGALFVA